MDAYYALILMHETGLYTSRTTKLMHMKIQCDVTQFRLGQIIPVMILEQNRAYKLTEARVVSLNVITVTLELHIKEGQNFNPMFKVELVDVNTPVEDVTTWEQVRHIPDYLDYEGLKCLHIGAHYKKGG